MRWSRSTFFHTPLGDGNETCHHHPSLHYIPNDRASLNVAGLLCSKDKSVANRRAHYTYTQARSYEGCTGASWNAAAASSVMAAPRNGGHLDPPRASPFCACCFQFRHTFGPACCCAYTASVDFLIREKRNGYRSGIGFSF
ncbi:hypothetical protein K470DRAFT_257551 [Piedraia hortae CBS 480.64]|uniref:Uncharacterized protein n=1 Tax=Piedraia hortae CBS 480.64 TaxID=1314780 RepID=A0A6A7BZY0_9PEZI|nr:hypothetical protein K470DRAFT_257551 [Piedraia hortae CBS 480.64]